MKMVFIEGLRSEMVVARDVYSDDNPYVPLVKAGVTLNDFMINDLKQRGIRFVHVGKEVASDFGGIDGMPYVPPRQPVLSSKLKSEALTSLEEAFKTLSLDADDVHESSKVVLKHIDEVVMDLVDTLLQDSNNLVNINDLKSYDDYTFHHSLSVAVVSIAIAQKLGYNEKALHSMGTCAMMHDIGKTSVPVQIIRKTSKLDSEEYSIVQTHSPAGFQSLIKSGIEDDSVLSGVLHHHEKYDGTGYPDGLKGSEIPVFARIISIADVYDALTSNRPYRTPLQPAEVVEYIMGNIGTAFDSDTVEAFLNKVELYPIGSYVELSNGDIGVVLACDNKLRPVVRNTRGEVLDLGRDRSCLNIVVKRLLPAEMLFQKN